MWNISSYPSYINQLNPPGAFTLPSSRFSCFFHVLISYILFRESLPWLLSLLPPSPANHQGHFSWCTIIEFNTFRSIQSLSHVWLFAIPWTAARQASPSITNSRSLPKLISTELVMPSNYFILCRPLLLLPSIFPSIRVFTIESVLHHQMAKMLEFQL